MLVSTLDLARHHGPFHYKLPPGHSLAMLQTCRQVFTETSHILRTHTLFSMKLVLSNEAERERILTWPHKSNNTDSIPTQIHRIILASTYTLIHPQTPEKSNASLLHQQ